jgi:hypothetical protein
MTHNYKQISFNLKLGINSNLGLLNHVNLIQLLLFFNGLFDCNRSQYYPSAFPGTPPARAILQSRVIWRPQPGNAGRTTPASSTPSRAKRSTSWPDKSANRFRTTTSSVSTGTSAPEVPMVRKTLFFQKSVNLLMSNVH